MVSEKSIQQQLKRIGFKSHGWGRGEINELPHIILPKEEIYEMVNGIYEGGFALLIATDVRVLLIDKKPLNFLTVEDLRFEMINELDYSHRLFGAEISITSGNKILRFRSYNQPRLRKLISHVQHCMAEAKKQQSTHQVDQKHHLQQINEQLQTYLLAQHNYQQQLAELHQAQRAGQRLPEPEPVKPPQELADYLFAQSLLKQHEEANKGRLPAVADEPLPARPLNDEIPEPSSAQSRALQRNSQPVAGPAQQLDEIYADGVREVFGKQLEQQAAVTPTPDAPDRQASLPPDTTAESPFRPVEAVQASAQLAAPGSSWRPMEINALRVAASKLPLAWRRRSIQPH